jgi:peroxiredoxin
MTGKAARTLKAGDRAPGFRLPRLAGGEVSLHELISGGPALLAFFKISCPTCQLAFPYLERIHVGGTLPIYGISQNNARDTRAFNAAYGITFPMLLDPESTFAVSNAYGITQVPSLFLVEPDGVISWVLSGWSRDEIQRVAGNAGVNPFHDGESVPQWKAG